VTFPIQRVPRGLSSLLSTFGGLTPRDMATEMQANLELLQFYGLTQWQTRSVANAALVEASSISLDVPNNETWVLFSCAGLILKTATQTALAASLLIGADQSSLSAVAYQQFAPFGATETGAARVVWTAPYPRVLPPGSRVSLVLDVLGTDANANCLLTASIGVLG